MIRVMKEEDYEQVYSLWMSISGFAMRKVDDSKDNVTRFIRRNPETSVVAEEDGKIVGAILCGNDGRRACFYHVCVSPNFRRRRIGEQMVEAVLEALKREGICKVNLIAFKQNEAGNAFWSSLGWTKRDDVNYYDYIVNESNSVEYNP